MAATYAFLTHAAAGARQPYPAEIYTGQELRTMPARADSARAFAHPSRVGDRLRWPDGQVTDLNGIAIPKFVGGAA